MSAVYKAWLDERQVEEGLQVHEFLYKLMKPLQDYKYFQGTIRINAKNRFDAYVTVPGISKDIYIDGVKARNRSLEGDVVVIEIFPKSQWKCKHRTDENADEEVDDSLTSAMANVRLTPGMPPMMRVMLCDTHIVQDLFLCQWEWHPSALLMMLL